MEKITITKKESKIEVKMPNDNNKYSITEEAYWHILNNLRSVIKYAEKD